MSAILFDLDGTVADTYPGIVAAVGQMLFELGLPPVAPETIYPLTGKGVPALVQGVLHALKTGAHEAYALDLYQERYAQTCTYGVTAYPGVIELLERLEAPLALLTNKPR